jgi:hypothetical protein
VEKITKDVFSKWGVQAEFQGKKFVPKSIDVYVLNAAKIRQTGTFAVGKRKKTVSDGIVTSAVHAKYNVLDPKAILPREKWRENIARAEADLDNARKALTEAVATRDRRAAELNSHEATLVRLNKDAAANRERHRIAHDNFQELDRQLEWGVREGRPIPLLPEGERRKQLRASRDWDIWQSWARDTGLAADQSGAVAKEYDANLQPMRREVKDAEEQVRQRQQAVTELTALVKALRGGPEVQNAGPPVPQLLPGNHDK